jgi:hypothetical protein
MKEKPMRRPRNRFADVLLLLAGLLISPALLAEAAGTVTHLSGPLLARKGDGTSKILSQKSQVDNGDLLISEKDTYARVKFTDNSEITLKPNTQLRIDSYLFEANKPEADSAVFNLLKGGLRAVTGLVGKRGNQDSYQLKAPSATIGIRGTDYSASWCQSDCGTLPSGLYVQVNDGQVVVSNNAGSQGYSAGQFGYIKDPVTPPATLPKDPGIKFTPPPSFSAPSNTPTGQPTSGGTTPTETKKLDCEVR